MVRPRPSIRPAVTGSRTTGSEPTSATVTGVLTPTRSTSPPPLNCADTVCGPACGGAPRIHARPRREVQADSAGTSSNGHRTPPDRPIRPMWPCFCRRSDQGRSRGQRHEPHRAHHPARPRRPARPRPFEASPHSEADVGALTAPHHPPPPRNHPMGLNTAPNRPGPERRFSSSPRLDPSHDAVLGLFALMNSYEDALNENATPASEPHPARPPSPRTAGRRDRVKREAGQQKIRGRSQQRVPLYSARDRAISEPAQDQGISFVSHNEDESLSSDKRRRRGVSNTSRAPVEAGGAGELAPERGRPARLREEDYPLGYKSGRPLAHPHAR